MAKKDKKQAEQAPVQTAPAPSVTPEPEVGKVKKVNKVHLLGLKDPRWTQCGLFSGDPRLSLTDQMEDVTCTICIRIATAPPREKKVSGPKFVTITCQEPGCGKTREVPAGSAHVVTRCAECQKKHLRAKNTAKRKAKNKDKSAGRLEVLALLQGEVDEFVLSFLDDKRDDKLFLQALEKAINKVRKG
jgi:hypothetical protein